MSLTEELLSALSIYGVPVLFGTVLISSIGLPLPMSLMLVAAGSFVEQGEMKLWQVLVFTSLGAVIGDQIGYWIGRWGGRAIVEKISRWFKSGTDKLESAEKAARKWEGLGVFLTRWLLTPLGPWLNLISGFTEYPWHRFLIWDALGQILWVVIYVFIGRIFSDRVQAMSEVLGNLTWVIVGIIGAVFFGWKLFGGRGSKRPKQKAHSLKTEPAISDASASR